MNEFNPNTDVISKTSQEIEHCEELFWEMQHMFKTTRWKLAKTQWNSYTQMKYIPSLNTK